MADIYVTVRLSWAGDDWRPYSEFMEDVRQAIEDEARSLCDEAEPGGVAALVSCDASG